ncbi:MAG: hypothetical protein NT112_03155 [Methanoregula sp.]|nr:hypothetical protein [Methanoregula sp.]
MRAHQTVLLAALILITLSLIIPLIPAADSVEAEPAGTMPANDTPLSTVAVHGTSAPLSSFGKQGEITLFRFELNQTTFPGPRSMAFGPRSIQLTASPATLIVLGTGIFVGGGALCILYKRKKAKETESVSTEEEQKAKAGQKKGE